MSGRNEPLAEITYDRIREAVAGAGSAIRVRTRLEPAGGCSDKVFPPTYQGGQYAIERRRVNGSVGWVVVLDSVQSQANRFEEALSVERQQQRIELPLIVSEFTGDLAEVG